MKTALALLLLLLLAPVEGPARAAGALPEMGGWLVYWQWREGVERVERHPGRYADLFHFVGQLSPAGDPFVVESGDDFRAAVRHQRRLGIRPWLTVVNDVVEGPGRVRLKDPEVVSRLLADEASRRRHIEALVALTLAGGYHGLDIDYENLHARDRHRFTRFIEALAEALRRHDLALAVTVQPKAGPTRRQGPGAHDWAALCRVADRLQIMLYNQHGGWNGPGPVATTGWMGEILDHALTRCPRERIVPVVKMLGTLWQHEGTRGVTHHQARKLAAQYGIQPDRTEGEAIPHLRIPGKGMTLFYEDEHSLERKLAWLTRQGFRRIVLWRLGEHPPGLERMFEQVAKRNR